MKTQLKIPMLCLASVLGALSLPVSAQTTRITYQGRLTEGGVPASGLHDFEFRLFDAASGGQQLGPAVTVDDLSVSGGLFTAPVDFGASFPGADRFLEISVRPGAGNGPYTVLNPRQPVTSAPYAVKALEAGRLPAGAVTGAMLAPGAVSQLGASDGSPANALQVNAGGLVGIGTGSPAAGLHVTAGRGFLNPELLAVLLDDDTPFSDLNHASSVAVAGSLAAVAASGDSGITLLDITATSNPVLRAQFHDGSPGFDFLGGVSRIALKPGLLAAASPVESAVTLINVSNPAAPVVLSVLRDGVGGWNELGGAQDVAMLGNLLAIAAGTDSAVTLVDISNPASPVKQVEIKDGQFGFNRLGGAASVVISGGLLAIGAGTDNAVTLVDVTDPASPVKRTELVDNTGGFNVLGGVRDTALAPNRLAIAAFGDSAVTLVDIQNPAAPVKLYEWIQGVNSQAMGGASGVEFVSGSTLAIAAMESSEVTVMDISIPQNPVVMAGMKWGERGFHAMEGSAAVAVAGAAPPVLLVPAAGSSAVSFIGLRDRSSGIVSQGALGIGTTAPAGALHVVGDTIVESAGLVDLNAVRFEAGIGTQAIGSQSTALGYFSKASGFASTAFGSGTVAEGGGATAMGVQTSAGGAFATAMGYRTSAAGQNSLAAGSETIAGAFAAVATGVLTRANGYASVAMGYRARALHNGSFVWADQQAVDFDSTAANQFAIRASGGFYLDGRLGVGTSAPEYPLEVQADQAVGRFTTTESANGAVLSLRNSSDSPDYLGAINFEDSTGTPGQIAYLDGDEMHFRVGGQPGMNLNATGLTVNGTIVSSSDRNVKENFAPADARAVLDKVAALPVSEWNYKADPGTRHIGPMAQDFQAAFRVGPDDKHIATVDADGVALAAIKGLNEKVEDRTGKAASRFQEMESDLRAKDARIAELEKRLAAIEALLKQ